jgi:hypothetical protein
VFVPGLPCFIEHLMSLMRRQPFIPQVNLQSCKLSEFRRKRMNLLGLRANIACHSDRVTHHNSNYAKAPAKPRNRAEVLAPAAASLER